jgi:phosphotransferase system enzyme I (PtsI)
VTDVGGKTSHTAIVARSMDIPAVVGARSASQLVRQDDWVIIDGDAGVMIVDPSPIILAEYGFRQRQGELERERLARLRHTPGRHARRPEGRTAGQHRTAGRRPRRAERGCRGRGPVPQRIPVHGPAGQPARRGRAVPGLPRAVEGMQGLPVTIRTVDVGADKPLDKRASDAAHLNPALGLRAIRWSLADPAMFRTQLRAILRAAAHGQVNLLFPMLAHASEIRQTLAQVDLARAELDNKGVAYGPSSWAP